MMLPQRFFPVFISPKKSTPWNKNLAPPNFQKSTPNFQKSTPNFYPERSNYFQPLLPRPPAPSRLRVARIRALSPPPRLRVARIRAPPRPLPVGWRAYSRALCWRARSGHSLSLLPPLIIYYIRAHATAMPPPSNPFSHCRFSLLSLSKSGNFHRSSPFRSFYNFC